MKSVVPDSFDDSGSGDLLIANLRLLETADRKTSPHCNREMALNHGIDICNDSTSKASLGSTFPSKNDAFTSFSEKSLCIQKQTMKDDTKTCPDYSEGTNKRLPAENLLFYHCLWYTCFNIHK